MNILQQITVLFCKVTLKNIVIVGSLTKVIACVETENNLVYLKLDRVSSMT